MDPVNLDILPRRAEAQLKELIRDEAVIAIHGQRSVCKSTVLRRFAAEHDVEVIDLDDLVVRDAVAAYLTVRVSGGAPLGIDEYQYVRLLRDVLQALRTRWVRSCG